MFAFGFASGLPWPLSGLTIRQWMAEAHAPLVVIGATGSLGLAYSLKFVWAPLLDRLPPGWFRQLGRRRGWLLLAQLLLAASTMALAMTSPYTHPAALLVCGAAVGFFSASQDISIDAWRIESFSAERQPLALGAYVWGYRIAILVGGAGVIAMATPLGWHAALLLAALIELVGIGATLLANEPDGQITRAITGVKAFLRTSFFVPMQEFLSRPDAVAILSFVVLFKLGEAMASVMLQPFYRSLGFDRAQVAVASGPASLAALIIGFGAGSLAIRKLGLGRALIATGLVQAFVMLVYLALAVARPRLVMLVGVAFVESFAEGLADAAFLTFLSALCTKEFTATQYALLSSLATIPLRTLGALSGYLAGVLGWRAFFAVCAGSGLPAMVIMIGLLRRRAPGLDPLAGRLQQDAQG